MTLRSRLAVAGCTALALARSAFAGFGFDGDPADRQGWKESYCIPINPVQYEMRQPDGARRIFDAGFDDPRILVGEEPWVGETEGGRTLVMTAPDFAGGQTGFLFVRGHLRKMLLDGREFDVGSGDGVREDGYPCVSWPEITGDMVAEATEKYGIHWRDRFSLWYRNPNAAGALLAQIALLALGLAAYASKRWRLVGAVAFAAAVFAVAMTESRSAMLGLAAGAGAVALSKMRSLASVRGVLALLALAGAVALAVWSSGYAERFTAKMFREGYDQLSRLPIWSEVPRMVVGAPDGWGAGNSGRAYMDWFQPLSRSHTVATLIGSHFTFLAEHGWFARIACMAAWAGGLALLAMSALRCANALPLAVWGAFFVALAFNTIHAEWTLWVLPTALLVHVLCRRGRGGLRARHFVCSLLLGALFSAAAAAALLHFGANSTGRPTVAGGRDFAIVGGEKAETWVVRDDFVMAGGYMALAGKDIRRWRANHPDAAALGVADDVAAVPGDAKKVLFVGKSCEAFLADREGFLAGHREVEKIVFVSPPFGWRKCAEIPKDGVDFLFVAGEYANRAFGAGDAPPPWVNVVAGCALYIPDWMELADD